MINIHLLPFAHVIFNSFWVLNAHSYFLWPIIKGRLKINYVDPYTRIKQSYTPPLVLSRYLANTNSTFTAHTKDMPLITSTQFNLYGASATTITSCSDFQLTKLKLLSKSGHWRANSCTLSLSGCNNFCPSLSGQWKDPITWPTICLVNQGLPKTNPTFRAILSELSFLCILLFVTMETGRRCFLLLVVIQVREKL